MSKKNKNPKQAQVQSGSIKRDSLFLKPVYLLVLLLLLTYKIYSNALHNDILTFDDNEYFSNYPEVLNLSWTSIQKYFSSYYLIMYQPLAVLSFALNFHYTGFDTYYLHIFNLVFHLMNIILVYRFIDLLLKSKPSAILIAVLFALHPMNVEAVSWISARSSCMYTFFYLLALISYLKYVSQGGIKYLFITALFFVLSLFSKAQAVTLPVLLLLIDFYAGRKLLSSRILLEKTPFFLLSLTFGLITLANRETQFNITSGMANSYNPFDMFFIATHSISFYVFKFFFPVNLCSVYTYPAKSGNLLPFVYYVSALLFFFFAFLVYRSRKNKDVILGTALFLVTISINIQVIPSRLFEVTERYVYFPYIGLYILLISWVTRLRNNYPEKFSNYKPYLIFSGLLYLLIFSYSVYKRNFVWKNDETLMSDILIKNPESKYLIRAYGNRGLYYKRNKRYTEAISDFTKALEIQPDDANTLFNRALSYMQVNDNASAKNDLDKALIYDPARPYFYSYRARTRLMIRDTLGSILDSEKCLSLDSKSPDAYNLLAVIAFSKGNAPKAEEYLSRAIKFNPSNVMLIKNRGVLYLKQKKTSLACLDLQKAYQLGDQSAGSLFNKNCH